MIAHDTGARPSVPFQYANFTASLALQTPQSAHTLRSAHTPRECTFAHDLGVRLQLKSRRRPGDSPATPKLLY